MKRRSHRYENVISPAVAGEVPQLPYQRPPWRALVVVSVVFLVLAGLFNAVSPLALTNPRAHPANPDEQVHIEYIGELSSGHLPVFTSGGNDYEAHQPPLYYALCAPVYLATRSLDTEAQAKVLRCVSTFIGLALVWVTFLAVREFLPDNPQTALGASIFVALLPMNVSLAASVSNDSLTNLVMALGLWQLARIAVNLHGWIERATWIRQASLLGLIVGLGIWTKTSTLLLFPVTVVVLAVLACKQPETRKAALSAMVAACVVGIVIGFPWMVRNTLLYGDPVARHIFMTAFVNTAHTKVLMAQWHCTLLQIFMGATIPWTFYSFWGMFASMSLFLPDSIYSMLLAFSIASLVGLIVWVARVGRGLDAPRQALMWGYAALILLTIAALVQFNLVFFQAQGRYLYTALIPIAAFFVIGLRQLEPKAYRYKLVGLFFCALLLVDASSIYLIAVHFAHG